MHARVRNNHRMQSHQSFPDGSPPRLLLCDDSPIERLALAHYLRTQGYKVDEAGDGNAALFFLNKPAYA